MQLAQQHLVQVSHPIVAWRRAKLDAQDMRDRRRNPRESESLAEPEH